MPLKRCTSGGKKGWRWGSGKCFTGKDGKTKAARQAAAAYAHGYTEKEEDMREVDLELVMNAGFTEFEKM